MECVRRRGMVDNNDELGGGAWWITMMSRRRGMVDNNDELGGGAWWITVMC